MDDEAVADLRHCLLADAEAAWPGWSYAEQAFAVQELMRIDASLLRSAINGEIAAGRDPYAPGGALDPEFEIHGPMLPTRSSILEREAKVYRKYYGPGPLKTSGALADLRAQMAE
jgi:hypothetical protein